MVGALVRETFDMAAKLTADEARWIKRLQRVLNDCPSDRLGFYTIGDPNVSIYDKSGGAEDDDSGLDFPQVVERHGAYLSSVYFPACVHSTVG